MKWCMSPNKCRSKAEYQLACCPKPVRKAVNQRSLRSDNEEVSVDFLG